jgi:galactoside O-acetyltransferase
MFLKELKMALVSKIITVLKGVARSNNRFAGAIVYNNGENVVLGENVSFGGRVVLFGTANIEIGDNTMIGMNSIVHTSTHDYKVQPYNRKRIDRPVKIGKNVWIGAGAIIMPGVKIGDNSVVGAGSVVVAHVPANVVVAGNPAKVLFQLGDILKNNNEDNGFKIIKENFLEEDKICKKK